MATLSGSSGAAGREDVAAQVAELNKSGLSNRQIAAHLPIGRDTVAKHLTAAP